jgi:8-oxo-dGTP pyrophosphatase MutT (NUDIX family)
MLKPKEKLMEKFWVALTGVAVRDNCVLLLEDMNTRGMWMLPGGRVDKGEDRETAFSRELREELGVTEFKTLAVVDYHLWYTKNRKIPMCSIVNLIDIGDAEIRISEEHAQYRWVPIEELDDYEFHWDKLKEFIRKAYKINENYE